MSRLATTGRRYVQNSDYSAFFDGAASYIDLGNSGAISQSLTQFSISARIKLSSNKLQAIVGDNNAAENHFALEVFGGTTNGRKLNLVVTTNGVSAAVLATVRLELNEWHVVGAKWDGADATVWLDGVQVGTAACTGTCAASVTGMSIGRGRNGARFLNGYIDDVQFWNVAKSDADMTLNSNFALSPSVRSGIAGEWLIEAGSGTSYADTVGSNTGTGTSVTWSTDTPYKSRNAMSGRRHHGNLVPNFDFENAPAFTAATTTIGRWVDGTAAGSLVADQNQWAYNSTNSTGAGAIRFDSTVFYKGAQSLKVSSTGANASVAAGTLVSTALANVLKYGTPARASTLYSYRFRMKTNYVSGDSSDGAYVQFTERNIAGSAGASTLSTKVKVTSDWTEYTGTFTTASTAAFITPFCFVRGNTGTATLIMDAWFDEIELIVGRFGDRIPVA